MELKEPDPNPAVELDIDAAVAVGRYHDAARPTIIDLVLEPEEPVLDPSYHVRAGECPLPVRAVDLGDQCARIVNSLDAPGAIANEPMTAGGVHIDPNDLTVLAQRASQGEGRARDVEDRVDTVLEGEAVDDRGRDTVANVTYR